MAKLTFAVAALVAVSFASTRVQAQDEQQFATLDLSSVTQDAPAATVDAPEASIDAPVAPLAEIPVADLPLADLPVVEIPAALAQDAAPAAVEAVASTGPSMDASSLSPRIKDHASLSTNSFRKPSGGAGVGLMILGGAALITGLIIGDNAGTVIAVGGALIGLYGLYVYLGRPSGMEQGSRIGLGYRLATN